RLSYSPTGARGPISLGHPGRGRGGPIGGRPRAGKRAFGVVAHPVMSSEKTHWEWQYLDLMRRIWDEGDERSDRTGIGTRSVFGPQLRFDLAVDRVPLLTTKRVFWKAAAREMLW